MPPRSTKKKVTKTARQPVPPQIPTPSLPNQSDATGSAQKRKRQPSRPSTPAKVQVIEQEADDDALPRKKSTFPGAYTDSEPEEDPVAGPSHNPFIHQSQMPQRRSATPAINPIDLLLENVALARASSSRGANDVDAFRHLMEAGVQDGAVLEIDQGGADQRQRMAEFMADQNGGFEKNIGVQDALRNLDLANLQALIPGLDVYLMPHQVIGVSWMLNKERNRREKGGILADDMGLGKTVQAIALMIKNRPASADDEESEDEWEQGKPLTRKQTLIVAPAALLDQWKDEIETKCEIFTVFVHHGSGKAKKMEQLRECDVVITSYSTMLYDQSPRKNKAQKGLLASNKWHRIILDEAQIIRNRSAQTSIAAAKLNATHYWSLTGTPVTNTLSDLYPLLRFAKLRPWNDWDDFKTNIVSMEKNDADEAARMAKRITDKHLLRRNKEAKIDGEPILKLKSKTVDLEYVDFTPSERNIYSAVEKRQQMRISQFMKRGTLVKNYQYILIMILRLRQVCCHPQLIAYAAHEIADPNAEPVVDDGEGEGDPDPDGDGINDLATATRVMGAEKVKNLQSFFKELALADIQGTEKAEDNIDDCPVCFEMFVDRRVTVCGHSYCKLCIEGVLQQQVQYQQDDAVGVPTRPCPMCRHDIRLDQLFKASLFEPTAAQLKQMKEDAFKAKQAAKRQKAFKFSIDLDGSDEEMPSLEDIWGGGKGKEKQKKEKKKSGRKSKDSAAEDDSIIDLTDEVGSKSYSASKMKGKSKAKAKRVIEDSSDDNSMDDDEDDDDDDDSKEEDPSNVFTAAMLNDFQDFERSAKMQKMVELLIQWKNEAPDDKVIIYSQWTSCMDLLQNLLSSEGMRCIRYDGKMNRVERTEAVKRFKKRDGPGIMLISLKCGGVGLNLVEANRVISFDMAWNYATESQAFDRVHRMGQNKEVHVKRIIVRDTIEERILELQEGKEDLAKAALGEAQPGAKIRRLGVGQILRLFNM